MKSEEVRSAASGTDWIRLRAGDLIRHLLRKCHLPHRGRLFVSLQADRSLPSPAHCVRHRLAAAHAARAQRERQETIGAAGDKKDALRVQRVRKGFGSVDDDEDTGERLALKGLVQGVEAFLDRGGVRAEERGGCFHGAQLAEHIRGNDACLAVAEAVGVDVKIIVGDELDEVLGVHILGPSAMEMIGEAAMAISMEATVHELIDTIHAHPTVTESIREAALASEGRAIHIPNKKVKKG